MSDCPSRDQFHRLFGDQLSTAEYAAIEEHVESCQVCQQFLKNWTDDRETQRWRQMLQPDGFCRDEDGFTAASQQAKAYAIASNTNDARDSAGTDSIPFPDPPTEYGPLGRLDCFHFVRRLGDGSTGIVFLAYDASLDRRVAIKFLKPQYAAIESWRERFLREARAAAALRDSEHIVHVFQVRSVEGFPLPLIVMEYVDGESLRERLTRDKHVPLRQAVETARQIALGLATAHERGLVHRDVKPENILIDAKSGIAKLSDFGLARIFDTATDSTLKRITHQGTLVGTLEYMSPEQEAHADRVDARSDVYSLGAVLLEMLAGDLASGGSAHSSMNGCHARSAPLQRKSQIPRDLGTICRKCLEPEPDQRYPHARALAEELTRFLDGRPIIARPVGLAEKLWRWCRRNPRIVGAAASVVMLIFVLTGAYAVSLQFQVAQKDAALRRAERQLYLTRIAAADAEWWNGRVNRSDQILDDIARASRQWEWHYLKRRCQPAPVHLRAFSPEARPRLNWYGQVLRPDRDPVPTNVYALAYSPDGRYLASGGDDGRVWLWDAAARQPLVQLQGHEGTVTCVGFHPDGRTLASASVDGNVRLWDVATNSAIGILRHKAGVLSLAYRPDGDLLATAGTDRCISLWTMPSRTLASRLTPHDASITALAFHPDGRRLLACGGNIGSATNSPFQELRLWDADTAQCLFTHQDKTPAFRCATFSPEGDLFAAGSTILDDRLPAVAAITVWETRSNCAKVVLTGHQHNINSLTFRADGKSILSVSDDMTARLWSINTGVEHWKLRAKSGLLSAAVSPDRRWHVAGSSDGQVLFWPNTFRHEASILAHDRGDSANLALNGLSVSPDGRSLAAARQDRTVELWDFSAQQLTCCLAGHERMPAAVAFHPDGQRLASVGFDNTLRLWDAQATMASHAAGLVALLAAPAFPTPIRPGVGVVRNEGELRRALAVAYNTDGTRVAFGGQEDRVRVRVCDARTGRLVANLDTQLFGEVRALAYSRDGSLLAAALTKRLIPGGSEAILVIWDTRTGDERCRAKLDDHSFNALSFSPDGRSIACALEVGRACVIRLSPNGSIEHAHLPLHGHILKVTCIAFSPDGKRIASGSDDRSLKLWHAVTGDHILTLYGHTGGVTGLAFSPDGKRLFSCSWDNTVRIWDGTPSDD